MYGKPLFNANIAYYFLSCILLSAIYEMLNAEKVDTNHATNQLNDFSGLFHSHYQSPIFFTNSGLHSEVQVTRD